MYPPHAWKSFLVMLLLVAAAGLGWEWYCRTRGWEISYSPL
ncbi:hypothetical protein [Cesiribacter andamanensis]|uniref:Uncharacterized protein n=1 Tax=Cesiribacter andamanensis AMV16 TaxID=1279009 RepID=M7N5U8_9BACT|nr:hypothetical protein [Cesiribacter andamanensis]EMR04008.1 hypothetical protein ADICEAN_00879 [Cesiribacter andamanensis AMV16]